MKPSDNKKSLFLDIQKHPENYTDEQIEAMMEELDGPIDVEKCWEEFREKTASNKILSKPSKKNNRLWWSSIAAAVLMVLVVWEVIQLNAHDEVKELANNMALNEEISNDNLVAQHTISGKDVSENLRINEIVSSKKDEKVGRSEEADAEDIISPTFDKIRIRGNGNTALDKEPLIIVNGHRIQGTDWLYIINPADVEYLEIVKSDIVKTKYEPLYGSLVENGVVEVTLKDGKEQQYDDILNLERKGETFFTSSPETCPSFTGGDQALKEFIKENLRYPTEIPDSSVTGRVGISFIVKKDGNLEDFKFTRSILKYTDGTVCNDSTIINHFVEEALRVCHLMPKWKPGGRCRDNTFQKVDYKYNIFFSYGEKKRIMIR